MRTKDIFGAQASTKGLGIFASVKRREDIKNSMDLKDVEGAQVGSLKKGPVTKRCTNPLMMDYKFPGHDQLDDRNNPFSFHKKEAMEASKKAFVNTAAAVLGEPKVPTPAQSVCPASSQKASRVASPKDVAACVNASLESVPLGEPTGVNGGSKSFAANAAAFMGSDSPYVGDVPMYEKTGGP